MCSIGLFTSVAGVAISMQQAAAAQAKQKQQFLRAAAASNEQIKNEYTNMNLQQVAQEGQVFLDTQRSTEDAAKVKATVVSQAADAGVAGGSVAAYLQEVERKEGEFNAIQERNAKIRHATFLVQSKGLHLRTKAAIVGATPTPIQLPFGDAISQLGSGISGYIAQQATADYRAAQLAAATINTG